MATTITQVEKLVGKRIRRREDPRLLTGTATYVDDIQMPGMHYAAIVRSPHAAARIRSIDTKEAAQTPSVAAIYTGKDTAKGRALAREPRATLCVDLEEPPYGYVQVQGDAKLSEDPGELVRTATAIAARYMGHDRAEEYGKRNAVPGELVVRLRPTKVIAAFNISG